MDADKNQEALSSPTLGEHDDHTYGQTPSASNWKRNSRSVLLVLLVVWSVLFFMWNRDPTKVSLVFTSVTVPLVWILLADFIVGAVVMYLIIYLRRRKRRKAKES